MAVSWIPIESNPGILTSFAKVLGLQDGWEFVDVLSFEPEVMTAILPEIAQARALIFLYPLSKANTEGHSQESLRTAASKQVVFLKQTIENACGTIALLHCLLNNKDIAAANSPCSKFLFNELGSPERSPDERAALLESRKDVKEIHESFAVQGDTKAPRLEEDVDFHFVAFVSGLDGIVYELDGRTEDPISCGSIEETGFFESCCACIVEKYISKGMREVSAMALVPTPQD